MTPSVDANTRISVVAFATTVRLCESTDEHAHYTDVWSRCAIKHGLKLVPHERCFAGVGGFGLGLEHGHWTKPLHACADQRRATGFRRPLFGSDALMVTSCAQAPNTLGLITGWGIRSAFDHTSPGTGMSLKRHLKVDVAGGSLEACGPASTFL